MRGCVAKVSIYICIAQQNIVRMPHIAIRDADKFLSSDE